MSHRHLHIESETFETGFVPLDSNDRTGINLKIGFKRVEDQTPPNLREQEDILWGGKVQAAAERGQILIRGAQYGVVPEDTVSSRISITNDEWILPVSEITYARIELSRNRFSRNIANVLAFSQIIEGRDGFLFVERGRGVAYHGGKGQLHALVAGNYPQNREFLSPEKMTVEQWLAAQQESEHEILDNQVYRRRFLGVILDRTLGYKPDIVLTAEASFNRDDLKSRKATDAWEKKGVIEIKATTEKLIEIILDHAKPGQHVPPGLGGAILELVRRGGIQSLDQLKEDSKNGGSPEIEFKLS